MASPFKSALMGIKETGRHAAVYGLTNALSSAIGIILIPLYTRYLVTQEYGVLSILTITMTFVFSVFTLGINSSLLRFYYDSDKEKRALVGTATMIMGASALTLSVFGVVISKPISILLFHHSRYGLYFMLMFIAYAIALLKGIPFLVMRAEKQSGRFAVYNITQFVVQVGLIVILIARYGYGIYGVVLGTLITNIFFTPLTFIAIKDYVTLNFQINSAKKMLRFGVPLIFLNISNLILTYFDQYFLNFYRGLQDVAIYNLGYRLGMIIYVLFIVPFYTAWAPMKYSLRKEPYARQYYSMVLNYFTLVGLFFVISISVMAYDILRIIATPAYYVAYNLVPIIVISYLIYGLSWPIDLGVSFENRTEYYAYITASGALLNIGLNIVVIPTYGYMGAAITTLISYAFMLVVRYLVNQRLYTINYDWKKLAKMCVIATGLIVMGWLPYIDSLLISLAYRLVVILLYPLLLYITGVITKGEIKAGVNAIKGIVMMWPHRKEE